MKLILKIQTQAPASVIQQPKIIQRPSATSQANNSTAKSLAKNFNSKLDALTKSHQTSQVSLTGGVVGGTAETTNNTNTNAAGFRIPSSRHFCGRLLSTNLSSQTETNSSSTNSSYLNQNHQNGSFEDDDDEDEDDRDDDDEEDEDDSPMIILPRGSVVNSSNRDVIGGVGGTGALSTSSPSTASSSPKSHSPAYRDSIMLHQQMPTQRSISVEQRNFNSNNNLNSGMITTKTVQFRSSSNSNSNRNSRNQINYENVYNMGYDNLNSLINPSIVNINNNNINNNVKPQAFSTANVSNTNSLNMKKSFTTQDIDSTKR